jgi:hypothetical protein
VKRLASSLAVLALSACCGGGPPSGDGGTGAATSSSTATGGRASSGSGNEATASSSGRVTSSGGTSSTGGGSTTSSGGASGGTTGGLPACDADASVWINGSCVLAACSSEPIGAVCALGDGGIGSCAGGICQPEGAQRCGSYGYICTPGNTCSGGVCVGVGCNAGGCPTGTACSDNFGCLATSCGAGSNDEYCLQGGFCCEGACISGQTDPSNCGACGLSCGDAGLCINSYCVVEPTCAVSGDNAQCRSATSALDPGFCCNGLCVDPEQDTQGCGACGQSCTSCTSSGGCANGQGCTIQGLCASLACTGLPNGLACSLPALLDLGNSTLQHTYGSERIRSECCGGACTDLDFDSSNCGACGIACPAGTACQGGQCLQVVNCVNAANGSACWLGPSQGEGMCCAGSCVDTASDTSNCYFCGGTCLPGDGCDSQGLCLVDGGGSYDPLVSSCGPEADGNPCTTGGGGAGICCASACVEGGSIEGCVGCGLDCPPCAGGCPTGTLCVNETFQGTIPVDACLPVACEPEASGGACAFGPALEGPASFSPTSLMPAETFVFSVVDSAYCCGGSCVDIGEDPNNCGQCGVVCPSGICSITVGGLGARCFLAQPDTDCLETCAPGTACAEAACVDSSCSESQYCTAQDGNLGLCCPTYSLGVPCADLANDPANCGGCGFICPSDKSCDHGVCSGTPANCGIGRIGAFCDLDGGPNFICCPGVGCTNIETDQGNCSACGKACQSGMTCVSGSCE